jgi:hypothetical protein
METCMGCCKIRKEKEDLQCLVGEIKFQEFVFYPCDFKKKINYGRKKTIMFRPTCDTFGTYHLMVVVGIAMKCIKVFSILYGYLSMHWSDKQWTTTSLSCTLTHFDIPFRIFLLRRT